MRNLSEDSEIVDAMRFIEHAVRLALRSPCLRSRCGSVLVARGQIIGEGWNSPPLDTCIAGCRKDSLPPGFKSDKTCCMHAEQRAILDAVKRNPLLVQGCRLYFIRLDETGKPKRAGEPYCTICSKMALDAGVAEFVLWHAAGICVYETGEYNEKSFAYILRITSNFLRVSVQQFNAVQKFNGMRGASLLEEGTPCPQR